ncbi:GNAT family N-acetyltransferase [Bacillus sp. REN3]|uniref:GNAT family N-acetyltransferase n=1 Tax=Bacillus sp. REN3 TaxID=2802440 RepID=UPI0032C0DA6E
MLRGINESDAEDLFINFSNKKLMAYYGSERMENLEEARGLIHAFKDNFNEEKGVRWGIQLKGDRRLIGTIGFHAWSTKHKRAEIGYELHPDFWGRGYAREAAEAALAYAFAKMGLERMGAVVFFENNSSYRILENIGFKREGILRKSIIQHGVSYDT